MIRVARKSRVSPMRGNDFVEHAERAIVAIGRGRADAPQPWREEHVAFDEALRLQFVAERIDLFVDHEMAFQVAEDWDEIFALVVPLERLGEGELAKVNANRPHASRLCAACRPCHTEQDR